jgi:class 3 adenylate cyclase/CHASE2 domain-containing sensor protein
MRANNAAPSGKAQALRRAAWRANLALCGGGALWVLAFGNPLEPLERRWFDQALQWRASAGRTPPADPRIIILGVDDTDIAAVPSLEDEYRAVARGIREASDLGAAALVIDAIYARGTEAAAQPILAAKAAGAPVVLAEAFQRVRGQAPPGRRLRSFPFLPARLTPAGVINITPDADGTHRVYTLLHPAGKSCEPSLALAGWFAARGIDWDTGVKQPSPGAIEWDEWSPGANEVVCQELKQTPGAVRLLNFRGPWQSGAGFGHLTLRRLHALHAAEAGNGGTPLAGKILFVANVATGIADVGPTSFGPNEPLVLLHATALNDLLQGLWIDRAPAWADALAFLLLVGLAQGASLCSRKLWLLGVWAAGAAGILVAGLVLLFTAGLLVATITAASLWTVAVVFEVARRHSHELAERQHLRSSVGLYFSPKVLEDVLANPGTLEPKRVEITVLLTDLRNSTPLAELLGTEGMLSLLNRVFEVENAAVFAEDGSLEKPVGDQFLAYWGAPEPQADAAERALRAMQSLIAGLEALRATLEPAVRELFGYGVAVHAGPSLIANIGSAQFFHYGVVGDLINATARIEALTKSYGVRALVTREVLEHLREPPPSRLVDRVIVKGKSVPLDLHEVGHAHNAGTFAKVSAAYGDAFALYQAGEFGAAGSRFAALAADDPASRLLAERCALLAARPPQDWRGVFKFESK